MMSRAVVVFSLSVELTMIVNKKEKRKKETKWFFNKPLIFVHPQIPTEIKKKWASTSAAEFTFKVIY